MIHIWLTPLGPLSFIRQIQNLSADIKRLNRISYFYFVFSFFGTGEYWLLHPPDSELRCWHQKAQKNGVFFLYLSNIGEHWHQPRGTDKRKPLFTSSTQHLPQIILTLYPCKVHSSLHWKSLQMHVCLSDKSTYLSGQSFWTRIQRSQTDNMSSPPGLWLTPQWWPWPF